jgi:hypothetical protein
MLTPRCRDFPGTVRLVFTAFLLLPGLLAVACEGTTGEISGAGAGGTYYGGYGGGVGGQYWWDASPAGSYAGQAGLGGTGGVAGVGEESGIGGAAGVGGDSGIGGTAGVGGESGIGGTAGVGGDSGIGGAGGTGGDSGTGGTGGTGGDSGTGGTGGTGGDSGTGGTGGTGGDSGTGGTGGTGGDSGTGGTGGTGGGSGTCCPDGNCICRGSDPTGLTSEDGPYNTDSYNLSGIGCVYYPTDADPPFSAVAISDGYLGSGGCSSFQTGQWGPFYASHGIAAMIVNTGSSDQPSQRAAALADGIAGFKAENNNSSSPLYQKLAGRYGTSGFSMGGGGTTYAASNDPSLLTSVALMAWGPTGQGVTVPTLFTCGSSDGTASCTSHGRPAYDEMPATTPKMIVTVTSGHAGQPSSGGGMQGAWGLAFQKLFLEGDERWRPILLGGNYDDTNIQ